MSNIEDDSTTTAVAIVSSNYLLRLGLQSILETKTSLRLLGHAANGAALDDMLLRERPDIIIVDTDIAHDFTGLIQKIKIASSQIRIILLSGFQDQGCTREAIDVGVDGIVLKVQPSSVLIATIEYFARPVGALGQPTREGTAPLTKGNAPQVPSALTGKSSLSKWPDGLTEREREVIRLISQGLSNKDIADRLCISSITVRHHLTNIFDKLGVSNRQKLLIRAHQCGIEELTALA